MTEEFFQRACQVLRAKGIPFKTERFIFFDSEADRGRAVVAMKEEPAEEDLEFKDFEKAVAPLISYMQKRKSQTHGLDGAMVIATYDKVELKKDYMGIPIQECSLDPCNDSDVSFVPGKPMDQENVEVLSEQSLEHQRKIQSGGGQKE